MTDPTEIEEGTLIGYHPAGYEDARDTGIVRRHYARGVIVARPDDPGIEERVPYDCIQAVESE